MAARRRQAKRRNWPGNLNLNGAGYFYWRDPDTKQDHGLGRDQAKAFAEARAANLAVEQRRGHKALAQKILEPKGKSLSDWATDYERIFIETRGATEATIKMVRSGIRAVRTAPFIEKHLRSVATDEISTFLEDAAVKRGGNMAAMIRRTLIDMFREAETKGLIETGKNPVTVTRAPVFEVVRSRLTLDQFWSIYEVALRYEPWVARSFELTLVTAQRREDVASMRFANVQDSFLFVLQAKTRVKLRIPVNVRLHAIGLSLDDIVKRCRDSVVSKSMLHHARTTWKHERGSPVDKDSLSRQFMRARRQSNITWESGRTAPTFHELRSLAARLYADQEGPEFAQAILGHKSASMTALYRDMRGAEWTEVKFVG